MRDTLYEHPEIVANLEEAVRRVGLEPKLTAGALVVADNTGLPDTQPYVDYVRDAASGYVSVAFPVRESDAMEISCRA